MSDAISFLTNLFPTMQWNPSSYQNYTGKMLFLELCWVVLSTAALSWPDFTQGHLAQWDSDVHKGILHSDAGPVF